jgi:hypothetical protein
MRDHVPETGTDSKTFHEALLESTYRTTGTYEDFDYIDEMVFSRLIHSLGEGRGNGVKR